MAKHRTFKPEFKARVVLQVLICDLLTVSRSSFYYQPAEADERELREAINQLAHSSRLTAHDAWLRNCGERPIN